MRLAAISAVPHQLRALQHGEVFGDGRLRDTGIACKRMDGLLALTDHLLEEGTSRGVGQGAEDVAGIGLSHSKTITIWLWFVKQAHLHWIRQPIMSAPFEFRYRLWILLAIFALAFVAPWNYWLHLDGAGPNTHVWGQLAVALSRVGISIAAAFRLLLIVGTVLAFAGAALRTWASAYMSTKIVRGTELQGEALVVDGPYRLVRNPLYLGSWLNAFALALLMPASGAIFMLLVFTAYVLRLVMQEEKHLAAQLGQPYADYCAHVPRLLPALRPQIAVSGTCPNWGRAIVAEIFLWGAAVSFAAVGWQYNAHLLIQCMLVSLGLSLVVRGFLLSASDRAA